MSAWGTVMSWVGLATLAALWPHPVLLGLGLFFAASFTLLLIAHSVAYVLRLAALWNAARADHPELTAEEFHPARRAFLRAGLAGLLAAAFGFRLFGRPRAAEAQDRDTCENRELKKGKETGDIRPHTTDIALAGEKKVCAENEVTANAKALEAFANDAKTAASSYCMTFKDCPPKEKKDQVCDTKRPTNNDKKVFDLNVVCTVDRQNSNNCQGLDKTWICTAKVTKVWCECQAKKRT